MRIFPGQQKFLGLIVEMASVGAMAKKYPKHKQSTPVFCG
jgi:hypothetical protein